MRAILHFITDLGDSAVLLPVAALVIVYLLLRREPRAAVLWLAAVFLCAFLTVLGKIGGRVGALYFGLPFSFSPSGHVSLATTVYGGGAVLVGIGRAWWQRAALAAGVVSLIAAVVATRLLLHAHTPAEIIVGFLIGLGCLSWFVTAFLRRPSRPLRWEPLAIAALALVLVIHAESLSGGVIFARWVHQVRLLLL